MNHYEMVVIVDGSIGDEDPPKIQEEIRSQLDRIKAEVRSESSMGRRKLAYPMKKQLHGVYLVYNIDAGPDGIASLDKELRLQPNILRHLIVLEDVLTAEQQEAKAALQEKVRTKRAMEESKVEAEQRTQEQQPKEKVSKEQLEKKLDTILDEDINVN